MGWEAIFIGNKSCVILNFRKNNPIIYRVGKAKRARRVKMCSFRVLVGTLRFAHPTFREDCYLLKDREGVDSSGLASSLPCASSFCSAGLELKNSEMRELICLRNWSPKISLALGT